MLTLAVDPGKSGGFAWSVEGGFFCQKMPQCDSEVLDLICELREAHENCFSAVSSPAPPCVYLEKVSGFIGKPQPGSAMFNFGRGYGFLLGVFSAQKWRIQLVTPQKWQKCLSLGTKGERTTTEWKRHLKDEASRLYPSLKVTLSVADALLILESSKSL